MAARHANAANLLADAMQLPPPGLPIAYVG
jgi:hypothetical protein